MSSIEKLTPSKWQKCSCCGEQIRPHEPRFCLVRENRPVRGETYCSSCEPYAWQNNEAELIGRDDDESGLRQREAYAAYQAAGCASAYWTDRDGGYVS